MLLLLEQIHKVKCGIIKENRTTSIKLMPMLTALPEKDDNEDLGGLDNFGA